MPDNHQRRDGLSLHVQLFRACRTHLAHPVRRFYNFLWRPNSVWGVQRATSCWDGC